MNQKRCLFFAEYFKNSFGFRQHQKSSSFNVYSNVCSCENIFNIFPLEVMDQPNDPIFQALYAAVVGLYWLEFSSKCSKPTAFLLEILELWILLWLLSVHLLGFRGYLLVQQADKCHMFNAIVHFMERAEACIFLLLCFYLIIFRHINCVCVCNVHVHSIVYICITCLLSDFMQFFFSVWFCKSICRQQQNYRQHQ